MDKYTIVLRLHDPASGDTIKKFITCDKEKADIIWQAKLDKQKIDIEDGGITYSINHTEILQKIQKQEQSANKPSGNYKRNLIYSQKGGDMIIEIVRTPKLTKGWGECEYKEISRMDLKSWNSLKKEGQDKFLEELRKEARIN